VPKKNRGSALESEEFEEDIIEEDDSSLASTTDLPPTTTPLTKSELNAQRYAITYAALSTETAKSAYYLRSNIPSVRSLTSLIQTSSLPDIESTLQQISLIRKKIPLAMTGIILPTLMARCIKLDCPEVVVDVLEDRTSYGLDLTDVRMSQRLAWALAKRLVGQKDPSEETKERVLKSALKLIKITRHYLPEAEEDPVLLLFTLHTANRAGAMESPEVKEIVEQLKNMGESGIVSVLIRKPVEEGKTPVTHGPVPLERIYQRVVGSVDSVSAYYKDREGNAEEATFFETLHRHLKDDHPKRP
jgi:hypothetical protein